MPTKTYLLITSFILFLIACEKEKSFSTAGSTGGNGSRLTEAIGRWHDSVTYAFFYYDELNRLSRIVDSENTNFSKSFIFFIYDADGRLIKKISTSEYSSDAGVDSFWYDDNDNIAGKIYTNPLMTAIGTRAKNTYTYDARGRMIADTTYSYRSENIVEYVNYTYDNNDNIISLQEFHDEGGIMKSDGIISASYSNLINPYFDLRSSLYTIWYGNEILSKHLRAQVIYSAGTIENYTYEFYTDGSVKKVIATEESGGYTDVTTQEFFYE
jgi:hypothetical protein